MNTIDIKWNRLMIVGVAIFIIWVYIESVRKGRQLQEEVAMRVELGSDWTLAGHRDGEKVSGAKRKNESTIKCDGEQCVVMQSEPNKLSYQHYDDVDAYGKTLFTVNITNIKMLRTICDALEECLGFNSKGVLKTEMREKYRMRGIDLFVKETPEVIEEVYLSYHTLQEYYAKDFQEMMKQMKIYMYDSGELHIPAPGGANALEELFQGLLRKSSFLTKSSQEAHLFYSPFSCEVPTTSKGQPKGNPAHSLNATIQR